MRFSAAVLSVAFCVLAPPAQARITCSGQFLSASDTGEPPPPPFPTPAHYPRHPTLSAEAAADCFGAELECGCEAAVEQIEVITGSSFVRCDGTSRLLFALSECGAQAAALNAAIGGGRDAEGNVRGGEGGVACTAVNGRQFLTSAECGEDAWRLSQVLGYTTPTTTPTTTPVPTQGSTGAGGMAAHWCITVGLLVGALHCI